MTTPTPEWRERLERFTHGESGYQVYPGGIFMTDGPSPFYEDLRAALAEIDRLTAALAEAEGALELSRPWLDHVFLALSAVDSALATIHAYPVFTHDHN